MASTGTLGACGTPSPRTIVAITRPTIEVAPLLLLARPEIDLARVVPTPKTLPTRPPLSLRTVTSFEEAMNSVVEGRAQMAAIPHGMAFGGSGWGNPSIPHAAVSVVRVSGPTPLQLVDRHDYDEPTAKPRVPTFGYLGTPFGLPRRVLEGSVLAELGALADPQADLPNLRNPASWHAFATEVEVVTALVDKRIDAGLLGTEGAALALQHPEHRLRLTIGGVRTAPSLWAVDAALVLWGSSNQDLEAWVSALAVALDGAQGLDLLRDALPSRDPLVLAGSIALSRPR